jgi:acetyl esterase/lipase
MSIRLNITNLYARIAIKRFLRNNNDPKRVRKWLENQAKYFLATPKDFWFSATDFNYEGKSVRGLWTGVASNNNESGVLLYIHGGAFIFGSAKTHMKLAARIASKINFKAALPDYRLAPEHKYPAALEDVITTYQAILSTGIKSGNVILAGDSAGGTLILQLINHIIVNKSDMPAAAVLLSPLTDLTFCSQSIATNQKSEVILPVEQIDFLKNAYLGSIEPKSISPLFYSYKGACPILIHVSESEILLDDSLNLNKKLISDGVDVSLEKMASTPHVWHLMYGHFPEAKQSLNQISKFLNNILLNKI